VHPLHAPSPRPWATRPLRPRARLPRRGDVRRPARARRRPLATVALGCAALALAACGAPPRPPEGPPPEYPGALAAPSELRSPAGLGEAFALEQRVRSEYPTGAQEFRAVLQKRGDALILVGFGPHGGRGFVLQQNGAEVAFESHLPRELPFPPRFMLQDVHRAWFRGLEGPRPDGEHRGVIDGEEVVERWAGGRLRERTFRRLDGAPAGVIRVTYEGGLGGEGPPERVVLDNGWFGYRLVLTTLSHQTIPPGE
jgi:hypothetical protein